jgi:hypothetical protein
MSLLSRDEYPFKSAQEGGPSNYSVGRVSLYPVNSAHNQQAGNKLYWKLLQPCGIRPGTGRGTKYAVIPAPTEPTTFGVCGNGKVNL